MYFLFKQDSKNFRKKIKNNEYIGNTNYQVIENYFFEDTDLLKLLDSDLIYKIMSTLIDQDYVVISSSARNSHLNYQVKTEYKTSGVGWHTDTRYIRDKRVNPSLIYTCVIPLEDFDLDCGLTDFIPGSHKKNDKPIRNKKYKNTKKLKVKAGSIIFFDSALWHKSGNATTKSRWAIFTMYGPWFMKPYFQFDKIIEDKDLKIKSSKILKLLHFDSTPPIVHNSNNLATLKRVRDKLKNN